MYKSSRNEIKVQRNNTTRRVSNFENIRKGFGGGLLTAIDKNLKPVLISAGNDDVEMIVVQVAIGDNQIRIFNCYGPQEVSQAQRQAADQTHIVNQFWQELETEVIKANDDDCMILIEMDANAEVGKHVIVDDPNNVSENGKTMLELINRQNLKIFNASPKCSGVVTRHRETVDRVEESVIDYILGSEDLEDLLEEMIVDDKREHVLTKFATTKGTMKKVESDHNPLFANFSIKYKPTKI